MACGASPKCRSARNRGRLAGEMNVARKALFDRLLIAQSRSDDTVLASNEALDVNFAAKRFWWRLATQLGCSTGGAPVTRAQFHSLSSKSEK